MTKSDNIPFSVSDLMTDDLITIPVTERVGRARDLILGLGFHALPVLENLPETGERVVGIVSTLDLAEDWHDDTPVRDVMTQLPFRIAADATLVEAAETMLEHEVHHLIVEHDGRATGLISSFDMLGAFVVGAGAGGRR